MRSLIAAWPIATLRNVLLLFMAFMGARALERDPLWFCRGSNFCANDIFQWRWMDICLGDGVDIDWRVMRYGCSPSSICFLINERYKTSHFCHFGAQKFLRFSIRFNIRINFSDRFQELFLKKSWSVMIYWLCNSWTSGIRDTDLSLHYNNILTTGVASL